MTATFSLSPRKGGTQGSRGWSLVELMVGLVLGLIVTAAAGTAFHGVHAAYGATVESLLLEQRGQFALDMLAQQIRHSGWSPLPASPAAANGTRPPTLAGRDDCGQPGIDDVPTCGRAGPGASDALLLRFTAPSQPDRAMIDCSGYSAVTAVAAVTATATAPSTAEVANLFYVAAGSDGEPQLLCRYPSRRAGELSGSGWTSGALVAGVETMQFRYGLDTSGDGKPDAYLRADEVEALGRAAWRKVIAVQIALVLRSQRPFPSARRATALPPIALLPARFPGEGGADIGFVPATRPDAMRRVFATTVRLRNAPDCEETLC